MGSLHITFVIFYQDKIVPADPITSVEKTKTLRRLNQVIQHQLVTSKLPSEMGSMIVGECLKIQLIFFLINNFLGRFRVV